MKLKKKIPLIDQHDRNGFWGGRFGGSFIPETLKKPVEDLTQKFSKLRNNKKFLKKLSSWKVKEAYKAGRNDPQNKSSGPYSTH